MNLSYWEIKSWLNNIDYTIVGSGIVGLNCALRLKEKFPKSKILILEKGSLPSGASTKNAGFACFGSITEIIDDLQNHSESEVISLIKKRKDGLDYLRNLVGDKNLNFKQNGGFEVFPKKDNDIFENCLLKLKEINNFLRHLFPSNVFEIKENTFGFNQVINKLILNPHEGQLDTGMMMEALIDKVKRTNIKILNNVNVKSFLENNSSVEIITENFSYKSSKLFIATNGFANRILNENLKPSSVDWPACGEMDIQEYAHTNNFNVQSTVHQPDGYAGQGDSNVTYDYSDIDSEFHVYSLVWTKEALTFYVNDKPHHIVGNACSLPFNWEFYLILNFAMGGDMGGDIDSSFTSESMEIDYVRVYQ